MNTDTLINVKGLKKHFSQGKIKALDGVDAQIRKGEVVVIIGPSVAVSPPFFAVLTCLSSPPKAQYTSRVLI